MSYQPRLSHEPAEHAQKWGAKTVRKNSTQKMQRSRGIFNGGRRRLGYHIAMKKGG
jgi:hypothetical protein